MISANVNLYDYCSNHVFYTTLHDLMWVNFKINWLKCNTFSFIHALMQMLLGVYIVYSKGTNGLYHTHWYLRVFTSGFVNFKVPKKKSFYFILYFSYSLFKYTLLIFFNFLYIQFKPEVRVCLNKIK